MNKKTIALITIILCTGIIIGLIVKYNNYQKNKNVKNFEKYLLENQFIKQKDGSYTKEIEEENSNVKYYYIKDTNLLTKEISISNTETYSIKYENEKIYGKYIMNGMLNDQYISSIQRGTYNIRNKKYTCKIITNNKAEPKCNEIRKQILKYKKELDEINKNKINVKYIN